MPRSKTNVIAALLPAQGRQLPAMVGEKQRELLEELLDAWRVQRGSSRHTLDSITGDEAAVLDFLKFARGVPGQVLPGDFERWSNHLYLERRVAASTQRKYQTAVRRFFDYVIRETKHRNRVRQVIGSDVIQVVTPENSVIHRRERELEQKNNRRSFDEDEVAAFLDVIETELSYAYRSGSKSVSSLQRDKALFSCVLEFGLRASEVLGLNTGSFERNPSFEEMGNFGLCRVFGKGSKWRTVTLLDPQVAQVLGWYVEKVRPGFLKSGVADDNALFMSERGARLSYSAFLRQFHHYRELAGLPPELVPHCLRHTSVSNDDLGGLSLEANRLRHGHAYAATTQGYMHHPDSYTRNEFARLIRTNLRKTRKPDV